MSRSDGLMFRGKKELPDVVFVLESESVVKGFDVYVIDTNGGGDNKLSIKRLFNFKPSDPRICCDHTRIAVCGSKLCAVGAGFDMEEKGFLREFIQFDLTNWKKRDAGDFKPEKVPKPKGGKPRPFLFAYENRLYALASMHYPSSSKYDFPGPPFEVYDPYALCPSWKALQSPPFKDHYGYKGHYMMRRFLGGFKVVGQRLYVVLRSAHYMDLYYSYSFMGDKWERINVDKSDTLLANLTLYGKYCRWQAREDFHDWMGFHLGGTKVLAHDLTAQVDESKIQKDHNALPFYDDHIVQDEYPFLVVHGLEHIYDFGIPCDVKSSSGFVAHLSGDLFCAVYFFDVKGNQHIHACKFELNKQRKKDGDHKYNLRAKVLGCGDYDGIHYSWAFHFQWSKMESKSSYPKGCGGVCI